MNFCGARAGTGVVPALGVSRSELLILDDVDEFVSFIAATAAASTRHFAECALRFLKGGEQHDGGPAAPAHAGVGAFACHPPGPAEHALGKSAVGAMAPIAVVAPVGLHVRPSILCILCILWLRLEICPSRG